MGSRYAGNSAAVAADVKNSVFFYRNFQAKCPVITERRCVIVGGKSRDVVSARGVSVIPYSPSAAHTPVTYTMAGIAFFG
ncbi:hypothetical protein GCM10022405_31220 [Gibbsiella dentisursi]|uniref:Uncharacterized protein n=1 Tax=Gibbsiella dentisursi TaxID=796890 RepID=A0ABP7LPW0_9GAMM